MAWHNALENERFWAGSSASHIGSGTKAIHMTGIPVQMKGDEDELHPNYWVDDLHFSWVLSLL